VAISTLVTNHHSTSVKFSRSDIPEIYLKGQEEKIVEVDIEKTETHTICRPKGELDAYTVTTFREALLQIAEEPRLVVDLAEVPFMDSAGLGALIGGIRRARDNEAAIAVACSRVALLRLLPTTGFDRIVPVRENLEDAIAALDEASG